MGGIKVGSRKIFSLAYADDIAIMAENVEIMKGMIRVLEKYVERKGLQVNVDKTKVMRCRKGGGRQKKVVWKWGNRVIEEVKKFKYLGYVLMANGKQKEQVEDRVKKGMVVMREVWGIGKRKFGKDWARRMWLFDRLVWAVIGYGVEIWGWKEREEVERIQDRYMKWVAGLGRYTPGYMIREEFQREKIRGRAGMRAWGYERKLGEGKGGELARLCWSEVKRRAEEGKALGEWEEERKLFYRKKGWSLGEVEERREKGELRGEILVELERKEQEKERWEEIGRSKSNKWYGRVKGKGIPGYLKKEWKEEGWQRVMKFRLGGEMRGNWYWLEEEKRRCRLCGRGEETWEHIWEECTDWGTERSWQEMVERVLGEEGEGEWWMRKLEKIRKEGGEIGGEVDENGDDWSMIGACGGNGGPGMKGGVEGCMEEECSLSLMYD